MSLINEALKKTQQERKSNRYEGISKNTSYDDYTPSTPRSHHFFKYFIALTIAGAVLGSAVIIALALKQQAPTGEPIPEKSIEMQVTLPPTNSAASASKLDQKIVNRPSLGSVKADNLEANSTLPPADKSETSEGNSSSPEDNIAKITTFLEEAQITGVRLAGQRSKIVINQTIYKLGDKVLTAPPLILQSVNAQEIVFVDELNTQHVKQY